MSASGKESTAAGASARSAEAAASTSNLLYHTIRQADGTWQATFGVVEDRVGGGPAGFAAVDCGSVGNALHVLGVGTDASLYHTIRNADGSWQTPFGAVSGQVSGVTQGFQQVTCCGTGTDLQVVGLSSDDQLYHTVRAIDGSWQSSFGAVSSAVSGGAQEYRALTCVGTATAMELVAVGSDGQLYHTIRNANGRWQTQFGAIAGQVGSGAAKYAAVGSGFVGVATHFVALGDDGQLYHTIRNEDGSWQTAFGALQGQVGGGPSGFRSVGCAGTGASLQVVGVGADGHLYHTIRNPDGSWQNPYGSLSTVVAAGPSAFTQVGCVGISTVMQLVGADFTGGWL